MNHSLKKKAMSDCCGSVRAPLVLEGREKGRVDGTPEGESTVVEENTTVVVAEAEGG